MVRKTSLRKAAKVARKRIEVLFKSNSNKKKNKVKKKLNLRPSTPKSALKPRAKPKTKPKTASKTSKGTPKTMSKLRAEPKTKQEEAPNSDSFRYRSRALTFAEMDEQFGGGGIDADDDTLLIGVPQLHGGLTFDEMDAQFGGGGDDAGHPTHSGGQLHATYEDEGKVDIAAFRDIGDRSKIGIDDMNPNIGLLILKWENSSGRP